MKKSAVIGLMGFAIAMSANENGLNIVEQGNVGSGRNPEPIKPREVIPFNKSEGVINIINDYNLIKKGKSKKGITKQSRIKNKVDEWLKSGMLSESDIERTI